MRGCRAAGHRTVDIRGEGCTVCNVGKAHIVFRKQRTRFFFGCDASTAEKRCPGPKEWQSMDVPNELRVIPATDVKPDAISADLAGERKRPAPDDEGAGRGSRGEEGHEGREKHTKVKQES